MRGEGSLGPYTQVEAEALEAPARPGEQSEWAPQRVVQWSGVPVGSRQLLTTGHTLSLGISL